jgi:glycosyltransferase involved in cell wall biosynthesis
VVFTNTSRMWGGTENFAVQAAAGLQALGHEVLFAWGHEAVGQTVAAAGLPGVRCPLRVDGDLPGMLRLARVFRAHRTDAVLLTRWREFLLGGLAARLVRVPNVVARLGLKVLPKDDLKRRLCFGLPHRLIVNAEEVRAALCERPWIQPAKVNVIHNGVDLEHFAPGGDGAAFRRELGLQPAASVVLHVGALTPQKDHATLVEAAAEVCARDPSVHFVSVGEGFLRGEVEEQIRGLGLGGRFHLVGFRRDVRPVLAAADIFVLSSYNEGMAWVLLEAAACGLPLVATRVSGTAAVVKDGENGFLVPPRAPRELAGAITALLSDADRRARFGRASRELAVTHFDRRRMVAQTLAVLRGEIPR